MNNKIKLCSIIICLNLILSGCKRYNFISSYEESNYLSGSEENNNPIKESESATNIQVDYGRKEGLLVKKPGIIIHTGVFKNISAYGLNESAFVIFDKIDEILDYEVSIMGKDDNNYKVLDEKNIYLRELSSEKIRIDFMGLKAGKYNVRIKCSEKEECIIELDIQSFDRSGYAHFNYSDGVGAYNDDGTLKENAIIIYVTNENKDVVMKDVCEKNPSISMFNIPGSDWCNKEAYGIGWWLNNSQYSKGILDSSNNVIQSKSSNTYDSIIAKKGFYELCEKNPIVIRFIGTINTPEGCTGYSSYNEGGSIKENGHMARMKNLKNITLEGVGNDAIIDGWGFHFICSDKTQKRGYNFEVRNLTFKNYPEDAVGMEGVQEGNTLVSPVQRCWIHNNTFLPGFCANPAESDKLYGDGSCDFKRGLYYTLSYNYFEDCEKTNLVGSSDTSLQYNITFHHNLWYNCGSRMPLLRRANIHFYNNYILGNDSNKLSYVSSLRADCYMFSENNYYEGCKRIFDLRDGKAKAFNNIYVMGYNSSEVLNFDVKTRKDFKINNCKYGSIDYSKFDIDEDLFYYDKDNNISNCYLTNANIAKQECLNFSGSNYRVIANKTKLPIDKKQFVINIENAITDDVIIRSDKIIEGVVSNISSNGKFRGYGLFFKIDFPAQVTLDISSESSEAMFPGFILNEKGDLVLTGSSTGVLSPGIYVVTSCQLDKDSIFNTLSITKKINQEKYN